MTEREVKHTPELEAFAREHAPALAKAITHLCGQVITKGLQGILEQCLEMQQRIDALEATLIAHGIPLYEAQGERK